MLQQLLSLANGSLDEEACLKSGFRKVDLSCQSCNDLSRFDLAELQETCLQCCTQTINQTTTKVIKSLIALTKVRKTKLILLFFPFSLFRNILQLDSKFVLATLAIILKCKVIIITYFFNS